MKAWTKGDRVVQPAVARLQQHVEHLLLGDGVADLKRHLAENLSPGPWLFPADQLQSLPYNRVVKDLSGLTPSQFLAELSRRFDVVETDSPTPGEKSRMCMYLDGRWYSLTLPAGTTNPIDPISSLDVSVLQERVLDPLLGIADIRTDKRIDFVGGIRGTKALEELVDDGRAAVAFSLFPVSVDELIAIADKNEIMPPKSTWFEPKLRDGLLSHLI